MGFLLYLYGTYSLIRYWLCWSLRILIQISLFLSWSVFVLLVLHFKGIVQRELLPLFFHRWTSPNPLTRYFKAFRIWLRIGGDIRDWLSAINYSGQSIRYSTYCLIWRVVTLRIIIAVSHYLLKYLHKLLPVVNADSRYSPSCLIRRVATPHIVYCGESLLKRRLFSKLWRAGPVL